MLRQPLWTISPIISGVALTQSVLMLSPSDFKGFKNGARASYIYAASILRFKIHNAFSSTCQFSSIRRTEARNH